ncbi:hypothetical protein, partial [Proteus terrae]|uniref:hypothetical protein n=1 Tax=Proteus terrae TaxID=1574161 RepID=UPI00301C650F
PPAALAAAFRQGWELAGRQETPLAVLILVPAAAPPQTEPEIDQASEAIWSRVDGWLDAVVPGVSARVIVRIGSPLTE